MKRFLLVLLFLIPGAAALCTSNLPSLIGSSVTLCGQNYTLNEPIVISGNSELTIDCQGAIFTGIAPTGFLVESLVDVTFKDCGFRGLDVGIYVNHSKSVTITGGLFDANDRGIYVRPTSGKATIYRTRFTSHKQEAIGLATTGYVQNNHFEENAYGVYLYNISSESEVKANTFVKNKFAAFVEGKKHTLESNTFSQDGISLLSAQQTQIKHNTFNDAPSNGISAMHSLGLLITRNTFSKNKESGAMFFAVTDSSVHDNTFTDNKVAGIFLTKESNRNVIVKNYFVKNAFYGLFMNESTQNQITENTFTGTSLVKDSTPGNVFCPANTYVDGARGPLCEQTVTEQKKDDAPIIEESEEKPVVVEPTQKAKSSALPTTATTRELSTALSPLQVRSVLEMISATGPPQELSKMADKIRKTMDKLSLQKALTTQVQGNNVLSNITTILVFKETMYQLAIYEYIPKSCAKDAADITPIGDAQYEVLNADPLIVWRFDKVEQGERINVGYTVRNQVTELPKTIVIEEDDGSMVVNEGLICADMPQTMPVAEKIGGASTWFFILPLMILLLGAFLVYRRTHHSS